MWNITCEHCKKIFLERNRGNIKIKLPESSGVLKMTKADAMYLVKRWEERWEELKKMIEEGDVQPYTKYDPDFSIDYCKGFDAALVWVESLLKKLEEK